ncbi:MAG: hypothetical protein ACRD18_03275, partial [Terriglobia bacterium]
HWFWVRQAAPLRSSQRQSRRASPSIYDVIVWKSRPWNPYGFSTGKMPEFPLSARGKRLVMALSAAQRRLA